MIDFEYPIYTELKAHMELEHPGIGCASMEQTTPPHFPFLAFEQVDCPVSMEHYFGFEQYVAPRFRIIVYTDNDKVLAKQILTDADEYMASKGFIRTFGPQKVNNETNVFQMMSLYDGNLINQHGVVFRR